MASAGEWRGAPVSPWPTSLLTLPALSSGLQHGCSDVGPRRHMIRSFPHNYGKRAHGARRPERGSMETPDELGTTCRDPECRKAPEVAGWCPGHAIARYKREARVTSSDDE